MALIGDQVDVEMCNGQLGANSLTFADHADQPKFRQFLKRPGNIGLRPTGKFGQTRYAVRTVPADRLKESAIGRGQNSEEIYCSLSLERT